MRYIILIFTALTTALITNAQIDVDDNHNVEYFVKDILLGEGVMVGNIEYSGGEESLGAFKTDSLLFGIGEGIVLSTGNVNKINGPNYNTGQTSLGWKGTQQKKTRRKSDKDLKAIAKKKVKDVCNIEFDFVPLCNKFQFNYVFASEEYPEYVNSMFNDVFAFLVSGPGINGKINLAVLPHSKTPISINTINQHKNRKYFRKNYRKFNKIKMLATHAYNNTFVSKDKRTAKLKRSLIEQFQFDGLTKVLTVQLDVIPYKKYHIKIAIADAGDYNYDSAVFIEAKSFGSTIDSKGEYYDSVAVFEAQNLNIDSILTYVEPVISKDTLTHTDSSSADTVIAESFELFDIFFDFNSSEIPDSSQAKLSRFAEYLQNNLEFSLEISGYTDDIGSNKYNKKLSEARADKVKSFLISKNIDSQRIIISGYGATNPRSSNEDEEGRASNRRVEIILIDNTE